MWHHCANGIAHELLQLLLSPTIAAAGHALHDEIEPKQGYTA
jgi:hypothetical protein